MKIRGDSGGFHGVLRWFSGVFQGISNEISDGFQSSFRGFSDIFRRFSVLLNQILLRMYSEHKSPIVQVNKDEAVVTYYYTSCIVLLFMYSPSQEGGSHIRVTGFTHWELKEIRSREKQAHYDDACLIPSSFPAHNLI